MPTVALEFRFKENPKVQTLMDACAPIQRLAVDFAIANNKTAPFSIIEALSHAVRSQYPHLHFFRNHQRRGKAKGKKPKIKQTATRGLTRPVLKEYKERHEREAKSEGKEAKGGCF